MDRGINLSDFAIGSGEQQNGLADHAHTELDLHVVEVIPDGSGLIPSINQFINKQTLCSILE